MQSLDAQTLKAVVEALNFQDRAITWHDWAILNDYAEAGLRCPAGTLRTLQRANR